MSRRTGRATREKPITNIGLAIRRFFSTMFLSRCPNCGERKIGKSFFKSNQSAQCVMSCLTEAFEATVRRYAARPEVKQTVANRWHALATFLRVPFSPGYNLERFEREQFHPVPPAPRLAIDDKRLIGLVEIFAQPSLRFRLP